MNEQNKKENPIRILQVLTIMNRGGAETMIMNYYRTVDRTKVQFDFLLHRQDKGVFEDEITELGGKIYKMPAINPINYFRYKKQLSQFFNEHPEYRIIHSHLNALSSIILKVAKKKGILVRIAHSHLAVEPYVLKKIFRKNTDIKATVKDFIQSVVRSGVKKQATHFFACGEKAGRWLFGEENRNKVQVINNAIDSSLFTYNEIKALKIKENLGLRGKKVIGHVGRFNEQKNHFLLIKIFKQLTLLDKNLILVLVGEGNLKEKIIDKVKALNIEKNVVFLGLRGDIPDVLQAFDIFLFPSLYEGLPVTLIEAQASGLKIVTSDTVTKDVAITDLVTFCKLEDSQTIWAKKVLENLMYTRENTLQQIIDGNYDVYENAKKLQKFYLKHSV